MWQEKGRSGGKKRGVAEIKREIWREKERCDEKKRDEAGKREMWPEERERNLWRETRWA